MVPCAVDPSHGQWSFCELLKKNQIRPTEAVYINWYHFDDIDMFHTAKSVERCFDSIWYPVSDDIELFDDSLGWTLSVDHDGYIELRQFAS